MKTKIVDAFQIRDRWIEEVALVKTEMANFLRYYCDIRIPALQKDIAILVEELKSGGWFECFHSKAVTCTPLFELSFTVFAIKNRTYKSEDESVNCCHLKIQ